MTTPDPITTPHGWTDEVRQAVTALEDKYGIELISRPHHAKWVDAACYEIGGGAIRMYKADAEKLKAENERLNEGLHANDQFWREKTGNQAAEITRLTSQLEQAERVIAPLYFDSTNVPFAIPDRRPLWIRADNGKYMELLHTTVGTLRASSQWIKDRQAKTDGEAS